MPSTAKQAATESSQALVAKLGKKHWRTSVVERLCDSWAWGADLRVGLGVDAHIAPVPNTNCTRYSILLHTGEQSVRLEASDPSTLLPEALKELQRRLTLLSTGCAAVEKILQTSTRGSRVEALESNAA